MASVRENPDLTEERRKASFTPEKLGNFFWDGQRARKQEILKYVEEQGKELLSRMPAPFMDRMGQLEDVARLVRLGLHDRPFCNSF